MTIENSKENSQATEESSLRIVRDSSLALLAKGASPALEEMVSRSLAQIQINQTSVLGQSGGEPVAPLKAGDEREFEIALGVKIVMCWIPPGEFLMGSPEDEEGRYDDETQHRVKITRGFWLAKNQTTQAQWRAVMGYNPSGFKGSDYLPVEQVSWNDICGDESRIGGFLGKLNQSGSTDGRFDLPTEAQWEYACRAGTTCLYAENLDEIAWYGENSDRKTHPVGVKTANGWGLHDMQGNVWEWCADWYDECYTNTVLDPAGPATGSGRVLRGGGWYGGTFSCRIAVRNGYDPVGAGNNFGFRIARSPDPQQVPATEQLQRSGAVKAGFIRQLLARFS